MYIFVYVHISTHLKKTRVTVVVDWSHEAKLPNTSANLPLTLSEDAESCVRRRGFQCYADSCALHTQQRTNKL